MSDWNPGYSHPDGPPPATDPDPNITDPTNNKKVFNVGEKFRGSGHQLMLFVAGAGDVTITTYVQVTAPDNVTPPTFGWVALRTGDVVAAGTAVLFPVPANAKLSCRITARTGTPSAFYAGVLSA